MGKVFLNRCNYGGCQTLVATNHPTVMARCSYHKRKAQLEAELALPIEVQLANAVIRLHELDAEGKLGEDWP